MIKIITTLVIFFSVATTIASDKKIIINNNISVISSTHESTAARIILGSFPKSGILSSIWSTTSPIKTITQLQRTNTDFQALLTANKDKIVSYGEGIHNKYILTNSTTPLILRRNEIIKVVNADNIEKLSFSHQPPKSYPVITLYEQNSDPVEVSFLTTGVSWEAGYKAEIHNNNKMDITGEFTITNSTDSTLTDYIVVLQNSNITLPNIPRHLPEFLNKTMSMSTMSTRDIQVPHKTPDNEIYAYSHPTPTTIDRNSKSTIKFLISKNISFTKKYTATTDFYGKSKPKPFKVVRTIVSPIKDAPLPRGQILTYKKEKDNLFFTGASTVIPTIEGGSIQIDGQKTLSVSVSTTKAIKQSNTKYQKTLTIKNQSTSFVATELKVWIPNSTKSIKLSPKISFTRHNNYIQINQNLTPNSVKNINLSLTTNK